VAGVAGSGNNVSLGAIVMAILQLKPFSFVRSLAYSCGQMLLGLFLHPYRSMQLLVRHKLLWFFVFYPLAIALVNHYLPWPHFLVFVQDVIFFFCLYWQLVLFYLWLRFFRLLPRS